MAEGQSAEPHLRPRDQSEQLNGHSQRFVAVRRMTATIASDKPVLRTVRLPRAHEAWSETSMKSSLRAGLSRVACYVVDRERTISFLGEDARTYATASMILDIERTCRDLVLEQADAGEDSVGMEVAVKHLAPTLLGMTVEITARVTAVDGRKVMFEVVAKDELDAICTGTHTRFVIDKAKTLERLESKAARRRAPQGAG
jgi:fluoroacetyl-CoA thioesterase